MDDWEAGHVKVATARCGEPPHHMLPALEVLQRPTDQHEIVVSCEAALLVLVEGPRRLQLTPGLTEEWHVLAVILDLHAWHEGLADKLVVSDSATPIQQRHAIL